MEILDLENVAAAAAVWTIPPLLGTLLVLAGFGLAIAYYVKNYIKFVDKDEQLFIEGLLEQTVVSGPKIVRLPIWIKSFQTKKRLTLTSMEYCIIKNTLSGHKRLQVGPTTVSLEPYDEIVPDPLQGSPNRAATSLKSNEYLRLLDNPTGKVRVLRGERGCVYPGPDEILLDGGKKRALELRVFEYARVLDKRSGQVRMERGENLVFLGPYEEFLGSKQEAIEVDEETAVLVRNKRSGQQRLVTEKLLFVPSNDEEILQVLQLTKLADYEACIVRDQSGKDSFYFGSNQEQRSFFVPPHSEIVTLMWSRGRRRTRRDLAIQIIDLRPMYMSFEFNCRTQDNVELVLEGSFFWEINDLPAMVSFTNDTTGDICNHARSRFIELVSQVTLKDFMACFNSIAERVHKADDSQFYEQRGVKIHSLEVTGYHCADASTAETLSEIIQETTNRINRLQQQESDNEVRMKQIMGEVEEEKARGELIELMKANSSAKAVMEGKAEAERVKTFLSELSKSFPDTDLKAVIDMWKTLRKEDALKAISSGNARLYFTPNDANVSIETHDHI